MAHSDDDFSIFEGSEHMFFGMADPFGAVREELEGGLQAQVPSARIHSIVAHGTPKFRTQGRPAEDDDKQVIVTHYGTCFQCTIDVESEGQREPELRCTVTLCVADLDRPGEQKLQTWMHMHADADLAFEEQAFNARFLSFGQGEAGGV